MLRLIWARMSGLLTMARISISGRVAREARVSGMLMLSRIAR